MEKPALKPQATEQGFMLVGLIVAIFLILLVLGVAAPRLAKSLRREREVEAVHRGNQYVRAVQLYYRKVGHYPGSLEQLEKTNNIRFLRQRYPDPMTGKPDWRLIHVGEAKTTVKGFFGKPLAGLPGASGLGSAAGMTSSGAAGAGAAGNTSTFGSSSFGSANSSGSSAFGSSPGTSGTTGSTGTGSSATSQSGSQSGSQSNSSFGSLAGSSNTSTPGSSSSTGISSQSATSFTGTGAPIMGVSSMAPGNSIIVLNEQTTYPTWEFLYDPRIEQLKAKSSLLGGSAASSNSSSFGTGSSSFGSSTNGTATNGTATPGATTPTTTSQPTTGTTPPPQ